jgi:hypothetical protein
MKIPRKKLCSHLDVPSLIRNMIGPIDSIIDSAMLTYVLSIESVGSLPEDIQMFHLALHCDAENLKLG